MKMGNIVSRARLEPTPLANVLTITSLRQRAHITLPTLPVHVAFSDESSAHTTTIVPAELSVLNGLRP